MKVFITILLVTSFIFEAHGQGVCGLPDGFMNEIDSPPADYQELEDGGYCVSGTGSDSWHYMCFTFTPDVSSIDINMGNSTICINRSFANFELYDNTCTSVGTGLSYTGLTPNKEYTFCLEMRAWGGPGCLGFTNVCPYWIDTSVPLPIRLVRFECNGSIIEWTTASEINNSGFYLGDEGGNIIGWVYGAGQSNTNVDYYYEVGSCVNFIQLIQIDNDGYTTDYGYRDCNCKEEKVKKEISIWNYYNLLGQQY